MAVFTAAALAVGAAIATTTVATVATAVVAVSTAVGVAGLAVGAVGMAIGNEDLMFAGKVMGYVGLAGGLAGGLIGGVGAVMGNTGMTFTQGFADAFAGASQHLSNAWDKGVGSWFSGGDKIAGAVGGGADDVAAGAVKAPVSSPGATPDGKAMAAFPEVAESPTAVSTVHDMGSVSVNAGVQAPAPAISSPSVVTPSVSAPVNAATPNALSQMNNPSAWLPAGGAPAASGGGLAGSISNGFSNMPDWMKYSMMTTGAQGITGLAGGYFQGQSAEEQLEHQKVVAQRDEAQRQFLNRNANQIPTIRFAR